MKIIIIIIIIIIKLQKNHWARMTNKYKKDVCVSLSLSYNALPGEGTYVPTHLPTYLMKGY
jgi:hypothetical protein